MPSEWVSENSRDHLTLRRRIDDLGALQSRRSTPLCCNIARGN